MTEQTTGDEAWQREAVSPGGVSFSFELLLGSRAFDSYDDNVDVELLVEGRRYLPTVFTLANVATLMERWGARGEAGGGAYFWAADAIIVSKLSMDGLEHVLGAMIDAGDIERLGSGDDVHVGEHLAEAVGDSAGERVP